MVTRLWNLVKADWFPIFIARNANVALRYVSQVIIALILGTTHYGVYTLLFGAQQLLQTLSELGLATGTTKLAANYRASGRDLELARLRITSDRLVMVIGFPLATVVLLALWAGLHRSNQDLVLPLVLFFGSSIVNNVTIVRAGFLLGCERYWQYALIAFLFQPIVFLLALVLLKWTDVGLIEIVSAWLIASVCTFIVSTFVVRPASRPLDPSLAHSKVTPMVRELLATSLPLAPGTVVWMGMLWTDVFILGFFRDEAEVGIYRAASQTAFFVTIAASTFAAMSLPKLAHALSEGSLQQTLRSSTNATVAATIPLFLLVMAGGRDILSFFGEAFVAGQSALVVLVFGYLAVSFLANYAPALIMTGHQRAKMFGDILSILINISLNLILIPRYGASGAALATVLSIIAVGTIRAAHVYVLYRVHAFSIESVKQIGVLAASIVVSLRLVESIDLANPFLRLVAVGISVGAAYIIVCALFRVRLFAILNPLPKG